MSYQDALEIAVEAVEGARLVRVIGELDASTAGVLRRHVEAARDERATLLLDLAAVEFIDSTGLRVLLDASRTSTGTGWPFFIVRPSAAVRRLADLSRTRDVLSLVNAAPEPILG